MIDPHDEGPGRQVADRIAEKRREAAEANEQADYWDDLWREGNWEKLKELGVVHSVPVCPHDEGSTLTADGHGAICDMCGETLA